MRYVLRSAALLMLLGCASAGPGAAGEVVQVTIGDLAFSPDEITARVGDTVEWVNGDFIDHTATANNGKLGGDGHRGALSAVAAHEVGIFDYFCRFHPNITPKIHVSAD